MFSFLICLLLFSCNTINCNEDNSIQSFTTISNDNNLDSNLNNQKFQSSFFTFDDTTLYRINWLDFSEFQNSNETVSKFVVVNFESLLKLFLI